MSDGVPMIISLFSNEENLFSLIGSVIAAALTFGLLMHYVKKIERKGIIDDGLYVHVDDKLQDWLALPLRVMLKATKVNEPDLYDRLHSRIIDIRDYSHNNIVLATARDNFFSLGKENDIRLLSAFLQSIRYEDSPSSVYRCHMQAIFKMVRLVDYVDATLNDVNVLYKFMIDINKKQVERICEYANEHYQVPYFSFAILHKHVVYVVYMTFVKDGNGYDFCYCLAKFRNDEMPKKKLN
jgi:hypothetical protein